MSVLKDFLLQLTLLAIPMFIYDTFFEERLISPKIKKLLVVVMYGLALFLCMSFPATLPGGRHLDLRMIPLLLGTLYGGLSTGIILTFLVSVFYILLWGLDLGFLNTILALATAMPVILFLHKSFKRANINKKIIMVGSLALFYTVGGVTWSYLLRGVSIDLVISQVLYLICIVFFSCLFTLVQEKLTEMRQFRLEVINSGRLRLISDLTSVFAHEIRNPMQVTRGFLQLINGPDLSEKKKEYIELSIEELDRANEIINDLLLFGKPPADNNQKVNVGNQLRRVINIIHTYSRSQEVVINTNISDDCWIFANAQKLNQCIINILKNAIESMPKGGVVWVTCAHSDDRYINISVKDQGIGMTPEQVDKLGTPFYSLKENGTGLGMMVSFEIIRSLGGKTHVDSEKDKGTEFSVILPSVS